MAATERDRIAENSEFFADFLTHHRVTEAFARTELGDFTALWASASPDEMIQLLGSYRWAEGYEASQTTRILEFLQGTADLDPQSSSWALLAPQLRGAGQRRDPVVHVEDQVVRELLHLLEPLLRAGALLR